MAETRFIFGVASDGVCADFYGALRPIVAEWIVMEVETLTEEVGYGLAQWGIDSIETYNEIHRFAVTQRNLFRDLKPINGAPAALRRAFSAKHSN